MGVGLNESGESFSTIQTGLGKTNDDVSCLFGSSEKKVVVANMKVIEGAT